MGGIRTRFAAAVVSMSLLFAIEASAAVPAVSSSGSSAAPGGASSSTSVVPRDNQRNCPGCHKYSHSAIKELSKITGVDARTLTEKYPQKTAWQIAKAMGKLDELKKAYLTDQKSFLDQLVSDGKITAGDRDKIYQDLSKRVEAIDGVHTVITGKPSYWPKMQARSES